ncbi:protein quiver [Phlebotomus papatasi]|uniref:protein quiver n=1 Tax=Phlebotomus papatasi TaxID=29031 RepID=UPI002483C2DE|nr:protein quiver [Phlebotomus papatasi]
MPSMKQALLLGSLLVVLLGLTFTSAIRCYQCSSQTDQKGVDSCGAYAWFNKTQHIAIECNSDESHMPGSFCMKIVQQGPRGFIWDGRWRQVIRRCASVADTGVTGVCNWGVYENGVYWEECYCSEDACNSSPNLSISKGLIPVFLGILSYRIFL